MKGDNLIKEIINEIFMNLWDTENKFDYLILHNVVNAVLFIPAD